MIKIFFIFLFSLSYAEIDNSFFQASNTSWFFGYKENNETNETNKTTPTINPYDMKKMMKLSDKEFMKNIPLNALDGYKAEDFKKMFQRARGIAVMHPTRRNVYIVKKVQKFMTDQATKFAKVWYVETLQRPNELEYPDIKSSTFARTTNFYKKQAKIDKFFKKHENDIGFVVFYNPDDKMANVRQKWTYDSFKKRFPKYDVVWINAKTRPDLVKKFNIKELPDNFYVYKNSKGEAVWIRIKAGLVGLSEFYDNILFTFENIIDKKDK